MESYYKIGEKKDIDDRIEMLLDSAMDYVERSHEYVTLEHLLLSIQEQPIQQIIKKLKVDVDKIMMELVIM